jgi:hypothetical protein
MITIGVDYHPGFQQIALMDEETGECGERRLNHCDGEAEKFYRELKQRGVSVRVGMEATGYARWFERLLADERALLWGPAEGKDCYRTSGQPHNQRFTNGLGLAPPRLWTYISTCESLSRIART